MEAPQFKGGNTGIFGGRPVPLYKMRETERRALIGLYFSQTLLFAGFVLILLNNLNVLAPGSYFGALNWLTISVFAIGVVINFFSVPLLYFSSFRNFKKEDEFWDKEVFWIMPLFFFGAFFIYGSDVSHSLVLFLISAGVIVVIHTKFFFLSQRFAVVNSKESLTDYYCRYVTSLKYLTVYYALLIILMFAYNPLQKLFVWFRLNA